MTDPRAEELNEFANDLLESAHPATGGLWPRASALLARQAVEAAMGELWQVRNIDLERCSKRAQLICLREYLNDRRLAEETCHIWWTLTRACHYHPYELAPTVEELRNWLAVIKSLIAAIRTRTGS